MKWAGYWLLARLWGAFGLLLRIIFRYHIEGMGNLPATMNGQTVDAPRLLAQLDVVTDKSADRNPVSANKGGMALLLWQCPVCRTHDTVRHYGHSLGLGGT